MARSFALPFYQTRAWRNQRIAILKRDGYRCRWCGAAAREVHHIIALTPDNIDDPKIALAPSNLISLCYECHQTTKRPGKAAASINEYEFDADGMPIPPGTF